MLELIITEEMIVCFHACAKKGDYQKLLADYQGFFKVLTESLKLVDFSDHASFYQNIPKKAEICLDLLNLNSSRWRTDEFVSFEKSHSWFISSMKKALFKKDWSKFYAVNSYIADRIIEKARKQEKLDLKIKLGTRLYENFETRDLALDSIIENEKLFLELVENIEVEGRLKGLEENLTLYKRTQLLNLETVLLHVNIYLTNHIDRQLSQFKRETDAKLEDLGKQMNGIKEGANENVENNQNVLKNNMKDQLPEFKKEIYSKLESLGGKIKEGNEELGKRMENDQKVMQETISSKIAELSDHSKQQHQDIKFDIKNSIETKIHELRENMSCSKCESEKLKKSMADEIKEREEQLEAKMKEIQIKEDSVNKKMEIVRRWLDRQSQQYKPPNDEDESKGERNERGEVAQSTEDPASSTTPTISDSKTTPPGDSEDRELHQILEEHQKNQAEQNGEHETEVRRARARRREVNKEVENGRKRLLQSLTYGGSDGRRHFVYKQSTDPTE